VRTLGADRAHARDFGLPSAGLRHGWSGRGFGFQPSQVGKVLSTYLAHPLTDLDRTASFATLALVAVCIVLMAVLFCLIGTTTWLVP
jgi:hypothetical protein